MKGLEFLKNTRKEHSLQSPLLKKEWKKLKLKEEPIKRIRDLRDNLSPVSTGLFFISFPRDNVFQNIQLKY